MRMTPSRLFILSAVIILVAVMFPGLHAYLTDKACLEVGILDSSSGASCPYGSERQPIASIAWWQLPTVASTLAALLAGFVLILVFILRDRWLRSRIAG